MNTKNVINWILKLVCAGILLHTLFFKFTGAEESKFIFSKLGVEPWGRIASGVFELIASVLILIPFTTFIGSLLALMIMSGAILAHIFVLGIEIQNDNGLLFIYALLVFISSLILSIMNRKKFYLKII